MKKTIKAISIAIEVIVNVILTPLAVVLFGISETKDEWTEMIEDWKNEWKN